MVVLGGGGDVSYERGTPVDTYEVLVQKQSENATEAAPGFL